MSAAVCGHGYPSPLSCIDCMNDDGVGAPPPQPVTIEATTVAKYEATCPACDDTISTGDPIALLSSGRWVHLDPCARKG